jgi:hypothetical protein
MAGKRKKGETKNDFDESVLFDSRPRIAGGYLFLVSQKSKEDPTPFHGS